MSGIERFKQSGAGRIRSGCVRSGDRFCPRRKISVRRRIIYGGVVNLCAKPALTGQFADIIQNTAGAVSLETMFVDEGFGSLDDQSRERAIRILKELAGEKGLVGIISHVNELKEQIDWKLTVTKSGHGSHARWII